ncbi:hypothetical protein WN944_023381 [Citrus x changshan-huyou]|uniref:Uncharacterized protein n=1 Tax=Citrus x changshan-huyou TaxID=2935761 RepID=A0AAP0R1Z0_9ROSI
MESRESEKLGCHTMTAPTVLGTVCNMNHSTAEEDLWTSEEELKQHKLSSLAKAKALRRPLRIIKVSDIQGRNEAQHKLSSLAKAKALRRPLRMF